MPFLSHSLSTRTPLTHRVGNEQALTSQSAIVLLCCLRQGKAERLLI
jgi:hypothetical protein